MIISVAIIETPKPIMLVVTLFLNKLQITKSTIKRSSPNPKSPTMLATPQPSPSDNWA